MARRNEVEITLSLEDRLTNGLKKAGNEVQGFRSSIGKAAIGLGILTGATAGAVVMARKFIDAAREQINSERTLGAVVQNTTGDWSKQKESVLALTAALQKKTNFGDEEQLRVLARVAAITGDVNKAMEVLPVLLDAASVSGQNLGSIANTLTRALTGEVNQARSLGITFDATATFGERLAIVQATVGGAAEANMDPFTNLKNASGDLSEAIGRRLIPAISKGTPIIAGFLTDLVDIVDAPSSLSDGLKELFTLMDERDRMERRSRLAGEQAIRLNELNAKSLDALGVWQGLNIDQSAEMAEAYKNVGASIEGFVIPAIDDTIERNGDLALVFSTQMANAQAFAEKYHEQTRQAIADLEDRDEKEEKIREQQEKAEKQNLRVAKSIFIMTHEIEGVVRGLSNEQYLLSQLSILQRAFAAGTLNGASALEAFSEFLDITKGQLKDETNALNQRNQALQASIDLQNRLNGSALANNTSLRLPEASIRSSFEGMKSNAKRAGYTEDDAGTLTGPGGDRFNYDTFSDLITDLMRQGRSGAEALLEALKRMRRVFDFDSGGVVPGPVGSPHLAVVHGGEQVLTPAQRGGVTVVVNVAGSVISNQDLKNFINRTIVDTARAGGGFSGIRGI